MEMDWWKQSAYSFESESEKSLAKLKVKVREERFELALDFVKACRQRKD